MGCGFSTALCFDKFFSKNSTESSSYTMKNKYHNRASISNINYNNIIDNLEDKKQVPAQDSDKSVASSPKYMSMNKNHNNESEAKLSPSPFAELDVSNDCVTPFQSQFTTKTKKDGQSELVASGLDSEIAANKRLWSMYHRTSFNPSLIASSSGILCPTDARVRLKSTVFSQVQCSPEKQPQFGTSQRRFSVFVKKEELGRSPFSVTFVGFKNKSENNNSNALIKEEYYACKQIALPDLDPLSSEVSLLPKWADDIKCTPRLGHRAVETVYTILPVFTNTESHMSIICDYFVNGSVKHSQFDEPRIKSFLREMLCAIHYLHSQELPHRHISPSNIFVKNNDDGFALGDIGLGALFGSKTPMDLALMGYTNSSMFPPEYIQGNAPTTSKPSQALEAFDLWGIGSVSWSLLTGTPLYEYPPNVCPTISEIARVSQWFVTITTAPLPLDLLKDIDQNLVDFLQIILSKNPAERLTCNQLLRHPALRNQTLSLQAYSSPSNDVLLPELLHLDKLAHYPLKDNLRCHHCEKQVNTLTFTCKTCEINNIFYTVCMACYYQGIYEHNDNHKLVPIIVNAVTVPESEKGDNTSLSPSPYARSNINICQISTRSMLIPAADLAVRERCTLINTLPATLELDKKFPRRSSSIFSVSTPVFMKNREISITYSETATSDNIAAAKRGISKIDSLKKRCATLMKEADVAHEETAESLISDCIENEGCTELYLHNFRLDAVPNTVYDPPILHVTVLDIGNNNLLNVHPDIQFLVNLRRLLLGNNQIKALPETIGNLSDLEELDLNHNFIEVLPQSLMFCDRLLLVALDYNHIKEFPLVLFDLPLIKNIYLATNSELTRWPSLEILRSYVGNCTIGVDNEPNLWAEYQEIKSEIQSINVMWNKIYPDQIIPDLYCGSLRSAQSLAVYERLNIRYLLTMGRGLEPHVPEWMKHRTVIVDDIEGATIDNSFEEAAEFIDESLKSGVGCLVHCFAGMSRSATAVIAYLMIKRHMRLDDAYLLTKKGRPAIYPNTGFFTQLLKLDAVLYPADQRPLNLSPLEREKIPL